MGGDLNISKASATLYLQSPNNGLTIAKWREDSSDIHGFSWVYDGTPNLFYLYRHNSNAAYDEPAISVVRSTGKVTFFEDIHISGTITCDEKVYGAVYN